MAFNLSNLNPDEQNTLAKLFAKGQTTAATLLPQEDAAPQLPPELEAGSFKDKPQEAMQAITQHLMRNNKGQLGTQESHWYGPLGFLGVKQFKPLTDQTNYLQPAEAAGLGPYLPGNAAVTPEGDKFITNAMLDNARQLAATQKESGNRLLSPAESAITIGYWKKAAPSLVPLAEKIVKEQGGLPEWLGRQGPSYRLQRSEYNTVQGFTEDGKPVEYDATDHQWYVGGKETPAGDIGRLLTKTRPQMSNEQINEVTNLLNAQNQLSEVNKLFDPKATGPIQDKLLSFQEYTGIQMPDLQGLSAMTDQRVKLRTVLGSAINDYIKAVTGAQMSEPEARRIMKALPKAGSSDEAFMPALQEIMKVTEQKLNTRLDVLETQDTVGIKKLRELSGRQRAGMPLDGSQPKPRPKKKSLDSIFGGK